MSDEDIDDDELVDDDETEIVVPSTNTASSRAATSSSGKAASTPNTGASFALPVVRLLPTVPALGSSTRPPVIMGAPSPDVPGTSTASTASTAISSGPGANPYHHVVPFSPMTASPHGSPHQPAPSTTQQAALDMLQNSKFSNFPFAFGSRSLVASSPPTSSTARAPTLLDRSSTAKHPMCALCDVAPIPAEGLRSSSHGFFHMEVQCPCGGHLLFCQGCLVVHFKRDGCVLHLDI